MYYKSQCTTANDIFLLNIQKKAEKKRQPPKMIGLHVTNLHLSDNTTDSAYNWLSSAERSTRLSAAPDHFYLNTYGNAKKQEANDNSKLNSPKICSPTAKKSQTIYDYIRQSIRLIEQQRNNRPEVLSYRIQRPFNEDPRYRRTQREKRPSVALPPLSQCSSSTAQTQTQTQSSIVPTDLRTCENLLNYINHSRSVHSTQSSIVSHESNRK